MARVWVVVPGGRTKRFRNRQARCGCSKRRKGRPALGRGICHPINEARAARRRMDAQLRRAVRAWGSVEEFGLQVPPRGSLG